jgi:hypothetical protein
MLHQRSSSAYGHDLKPLLPMKKNNKRSSSTPSSTREYEYDGDILATRNYHNRYMKQNKNCMNDMDDNSSTRFRKRTLFFGILFMIFLTSMAIGIRKYFNTLSASNVDDEHHLYGTTTKNNIPSSAARFNRQQRKEEENQVVFSPVAEGDSRVERFMAKSNCTLNFFLAWTTNAAKFSLRYRRTVESTLKFHPGACLIVYSPTMQLDHFQRFWDLGYNIIVERPDVPYLIRGTPAEAWYKGIDKWKNGEYFFSHITEIIRLATLWKYGGVYLDTDVVVMRELDNLHNAVGTELADERGEAKVLNGAVLAFRKGSTFIHECMVEFNTTYRIDSWGWNGPQLVTRVAARFPQGPELQILPTIGFYPIHWAKVKKYFTDEDPADQHAVWERMKRETYLFHYWNKITVKLVPTSGSLMYKVLNNYCLFCEETGMDG